MRRIIFIILAIAWTAICHAQYYNHDYQSAVAHAYRGMAQLEQMGDAFVKGFAESLHESREEAWRQHYSNPLNCFGQAIRDIANGNDEDAYFMLANIVCDDDGYKHYKNKRENPTVYMTAAKFLGFMYELGMYVPKNDKFAREWFVEGEAESELNRIRQSGFTPRSETAAVIKYIRNACNNMLVSSYPGTTPSYSGYGDSYKASPSTSSPKTCMQCYGTGHCSVCVEGVMHHGYTNTTSVCSICNGTGKCTSCRGTGKK